MSNEIPKLSIASDKKLDAILDLLVDIRATQELEAQKFLYHTVMGNEAEFEELNKKRTERHDDMRAQIITYLNADYGSVTSG